MPLSNDNEKGRNKVTETRRKSDKLSSKLPTLAVKALYVLVIAVCVTCSYFVYLVDNSLWGLVYSVLFCVPAGMALVELFPGKWKGESDE